VFGFFLPHPTFVRMNRRQAVREVGIIWSV
jgi:hypothetical protein